jgi:acyl carrier protein
MTETIGNRIRQFVLKTFPLARKCGLEDSQKWLETGILDSLGMLDVVQFLEQEFSISISDEELLPQNFDSLAAVTAFVQNKLRGSAETVPPDGARTSLPG